MSATKPPKTSARTRREAKPIVLPSGRDGSDPATPPADSIGHARGRSSNGARPTTSAPNPIPATSAAPAFPLSTSLREFVAENPQLQTRDEIASAYVAQIADSELRRALHAAIRGHIYNLVNTQGSDSWRDRSSTEPAGENRSAKWDAVKAAHDDGSLAFYQQIVDRRFFYKGKLTRFGSMGLTDVEALVDLRGRQELAIKRQREQFLRVHQQMRTTGAKTVDELDKDWLVREWAHE